MKTRVKSGGFDLFNALLEAKVHQRRDKLKGTSPISRTLFGSP
jgi:hypothetical protein